MSTEPSQEQAPWPADAVRHRLIGDWHFYQRRGGHRTSTDDLIVAWYASTRLLRPPGRYLDLGCGIGSVLLMVCRRLAPDLAIGVEAQSQSVQMARRSVAELPESSSIEVCHADLRDFCSDHRFDLITGSPPYFSLDEGVLPKDEQRRACRFEVRGGVEFYVQAAARLLAEDGVFALVYPTRLQERIHSEARSQGLFLHGQADFWMRSDRPDPFLSVFDLRRHPCSDPQHKTCSVRDEKGEIHAEYKVIRAELGVDE